MRLHLTGRHYIYNEATFKVLEECKMKLINTGGIIRDLNGDLGVTLFISCNPASISEEILNKISEIIETIRGFGIEVDFRSGVTTANLKFYQTFFENRRQGFDIIGMFDLDQFPIYSKHNVDAIFNIANRMIDENSLYCNCARDVPVVLGINEKASDLRRIHELIYSCVAECRFVAKEPSWEISSLNSYRQIGDITSGFYLVNPNHVDFERFKEEIGKDKNVLYQSGFFVEYFAPIWAALNSRITTGYVYAYENPYYYNPSAEEEIERVMSEVLNSTRIISRTSVGYKLREALRNEEMILEKLGGHFDHGDVKTILGVMKVIAFPGEQL
jgi:hypothetical protein